MKEINLQGKRFSSLVVLSRYPKNTKSGQSLWNVRCDCGKEFVAKSQSLRSEKTRHCGCQSNQRYFRKNYEEYSDVYFIWKKMKEEEFNHPEWNHFKIFLHDMKIPKKNQRLSRYNEEEEYSKENCYWKEFH